MTDDPWDHLITGLRSGDARVVHEFYNKYGAMMEALADKHLARGLRRRIGPEDVVQSACRTFLRRAKEGEFDIADAAGLWRLLCTITLTKVREQRVSRTASAAAPAARSLTPPDGSLSGGPSSTLPAPDEVAEFDDQFRLIMESLNPEERELLKLKLEDCTNEEAAEKLGSSERTVRRLMQQIRARLISRFEEEGTK